MCFGNVQVLKRNHDQTGIEANELFNPNDSKQDA
jgi:hypothetical protein